jgi:hypothetical protein
MSTGSEKFLEKTPRRLARRFQRISSPHGEGAILKFLLSCGYIGRSSTRFLLLPNDFQKAKQAKKIAPHPDGLCALSNQSIGHRIR